MTDDNDFSTTSFLTEDQEPKESTVVKNSGQINQDENVYSNSNGQTGNIYDSVVAIKEEHANKAYKEEKEVGEAADNNNGSLGSQSLNYHPEDNSESMNPVR